MAPGAATNALFAPGTFAQRGTRACGGTELAVWTVADPGFLAPEPYVHWHNPAIFLTPANATKPVPFPEAELETCPGRDPSGARDAS